MARRGEAIPEKPMRSIDRQGMYRTELKHHVEHRMLTCSAEIRKKVFRHLLPT